MVEHKIENEGGSGVGLYSAHPFRPSMPPWLRHLSCLRAAPGTHGLRITIAAAPPPTLFAFSQNKWMDGRARPRPVAAAARSLGVLLRTNWRVRAYKFPQTGTLNGRTV